MCIGRKHYNRISQRKKLISIRIGLDVTFIKGQGELPNDSFNLLCFAREPKFAKQSSHGSVELHAFEVEEFAVGVEDG